MADLKIVISALNKASGDLNKVKLDIQGIKGAGEESSSAVDSFGSSLTGLIGNAALVTAAVAGVGLAIKEVYESAKEAAELDYAQTKFDNLAASIGTVSDALLGDLRNATSGMVSDAELVAGAADFMALGLAKTHEEVVRLTTVAGALGMNMNQLVLTLTNQTTMRFDTLGVSVDGFKEKVKALEDAGMSANDAFKEAFLQQAEEQIERVGSKADTAAGSFARFEAATANLKNALANELLPLITPLVEGLTDIIDLSDEGMATQAGNAALAVMQWSSVRAEWDIMRYVMSGMNDEADSMSLHIMELNEQFGPEVFFGGSRTQAIVDTYINGLETAGEAAEGATTAIQAVADATKNADAAMRAYSESLLFKIASEGLSEEGALALARAMGLIDQNTVAATEQVNFYQGLLDSGIITQRQYNLLVADLAENIENLPEGKNLEVTTNSEEVLAVLAEIEMRKFKNKSLTVNVDLDTSDVDGYQPPTKYGTVTYLPSRGMNQAVGGPVTAGQQYNWQEYGYRGEVLVPSADGFVLSRADAERALARALYSGESAIDPDRIGKAVAQAMSGVTSNKKGGNVYNLTMPTSNNPADVRTAFELMEAWA
ncbi:MAG: hypothetical protein RBT66_01155 [bacterium]|jgi:hypothetical protein|nr:hypothetical protein [bacterium]